MLLWADDAVAGPEAKTGGGTRNVQSKKEYVQEGDRSCIQLYSIYEGELGPREERVKSEVGLGKVTGQSS